jgi:hypothetical protein
MKHLFIVLVWALGLSFSFPYIKGENEEHPPVVDWPASNGAKSLESETAATVEAFVEDNTLSLQSAEAIPYVVVSIYNMSGVLVYQTTLTGGSQTQYQLPLNLPSGSYQLVLANARYGMASGYFTIG